MSEPSVLLHREGPVLRVVLNRPAVRNAVDSEMSRLLLDLFTSIDDDDELRVIMISANGPSFCAGADLAERKGRDAAWTRARRRLGLATYQAINNCPKPVVAVVHGNVFGSGGEIALSCDFILGSRSVRFRFPEPHWGTIGATQRLQRVVGVARAKEMLFTNRVVESEEAARIGLITSLVDDADLDRTADEMAASIATAPALAMRLTKRAIDLGAETDLDRGIRIEMAAIEHNLAAGEWSAGVDRFAAGTRHEN